MIQSNLTTMANIFNNFFYWTFLFINTFWTINLFTIFRVHYIGKDNIYKKLVKSEQKMDFVAVPNIA